MHVVVVLAIVADAMPEHDEGVEGEEEVSAGEVHRVKGDGVAPPRSVAQGDDDHLPIRGATRLLTRYHALGFLEHAKIGEIQNYYARFSRKC